MLSLLLAATLLVGQTFGGPVALSGVLAPRAAGDITEFIALGESYATGVGAGTPDESVLFTRCLRYDKAYPRVLSRDTALSGPAGEARLTNNACSGQTIPQILAAQFGTTGTKNFKAFGQPQFAVMSAAGDDIEFKELVLSCIYEFPYKPRPCQEQIARSTSLLNDPAFVVSIQNLIQTTLNAGQANFNDFRLYYLGYAQFFNTGTTIPDFCSERTWSLCKPWQFGCEKLALSIDLRNQLNQLAVVLNQRIQQAVDSFSGTDKDENGVPLVKYMDIDSLIQGHRYCEQGKQEPVKNDPDIWFFQWLDDETTVDDNKHEFYNLVANNFSVPDIETFQNESISGDLTISTSGNLVIGVEDFLEAEAFVANTNPSLGDAINATGAITNRVKTFHPTIPYHEMIEQRLLALIQADFQPTSTSCNFTQGSCDSFQSTCPSGTSASCVEDEGTGAGLCQCLDTFNPSSANLSSPNSNSPNLSSSNLIIPNPIMNYVKRYTELHW